MSTTSCRRRIPTAMQHTSTVHPQAEYRGGGGRAKRFTYTCGSGQYSGQSVTVRACDGRAADLWFRTVQRSVRDRAGRRWTRLAITPRAAETRTCWPACKTHSSPPQLSPVHRAAHPVAVAFRSQLRIGAKGGDGLPSADLHDDVGWTVCTPQPRREAMSKAVPAVSRRSRRP